MRVRCAAFATTRPLRGSCLLSVDHLILRSWQLSCHHQHPVVLDFVSLTPPLVSLIPCGVGELRPPALQALVKELMGWITALHLRAPHSTVILVGTHSDKITGGWYSWMLSRVGLAPSVPSVMADVEEELKAKHEAWKARRGIPTDDGLTVQEGIVLVSSSPEAADNNVSELLDRLDSQEGTTSFIPPSWSLALVVLDALKYGKDPLFASLCWANDRPLPVSEVKRTWVETRIIMEAWQEVQDGLPPDRKAGDPSFAMESAIKLR